MGFLDRLLSRTPNPDEGPLRKLNACVVHAGGLLGIVGESYRQDELRKLPHTLRLRVISRARLVARAVPSLLSPGSAMKCTATDGSSSTARRRCLLLL